MILSILEKENFSKEDIIYLLSCNAIERKELFRKALAIKKEYVGNKVYFRGLIEYSNKCGKNCYYCGIRASNSEVSRYTLAKQEVLDAAMFAYKSNYGSLVIQSGEKANEQFINEIEELIIEIKKLSNNNLGITISLGEQTQETYQRWFNAGAHRYLLRIEASNQNLYKQLHPNDENHSFDKRLECLKTLKSIGYQVGTGVMIGLPFQTISDLADDLIFLKEFDIDMCGMGPYIEHEKTPLYKYKDSLPEKEDRFVLSLKMVAILRIMMKNINIAATTAMQTLDPSGREKAIMAGANIIMPNLTPVKYRENYLLYEDKPCIDEEAEECKNCLEARIKIAGASIGYNEWGDSKHFIEKKR